MTEPLLEENKRLRSENNRLVDELAGKRASARSRMRRECMKYSANIMCPCGQILTFLGELDDHLDHMIDREAE